MTRPHVSPAERARMVQLYDQGLDVRAVSKEVGRSYLTTYRHLVAGGARMRPPGPAGPRLRNLDGAELKRQYEQEHLSIQALAARHEASPQTIERRLHAAGTAMRPRGGSRKDDKTAGQPPSG